jgi:hypothetical protein
MRIGEKSMRLTGLEIPEKYFPYRFFLKIVLGSQIGFIMAENGVFSEEWANMRDPSGTC